jgi:hypothetical protein
MLDVTVYTIESVSSTRIHAESIDMEFFSKESKVRIFISLSLAQELIQKVALAILIPKKEESL